QVWLCQLSHSQFVCFESIGQLPYNGNRSLATAGLWLIDRAVPDRPLDAQFLAVKVLPTQTANLSLAESGQSSRKHDCSLRLREERQHLRHFRSALGRDDVRLLLSW